MPRKYSGPSMEEMFNSMMASMPHQEEKGPKQKKEAGTMWRAMIYQVDELILDHAQNDYEKVLRFTMNAMAELVSNHAPDYRITIQNKDGHVYFFAIGEKTQVVDFKKASAA